MVDIMLYSELMKQVQKQIPSILWVNVSLLKLMIKHQYLILCLIINIQYHLTIQIQRHYFLVLIHQKYILTMKKAHFQKMNMVKLVIISIAIQIKIVQKYI